MSWHGVTNIRADASKLGLSKKGTFMHFPIYILPILLLSFITCIILTRTLIIMLPKWGLIDVPGERRQHKKNTPRGGGIAVLIAFSMGFVLIDYLWLQNAYSISLLAPLWMIGIISVYDDISHVNVAIRLLLQIIIAAYLCYFFLLPHQLFHGELPDAVDFIMALLAFAGFMNIYNFMDGMDGMTVSQSIHLSLTMLIIAFLRYDVIFHVELVFMIASLVLVCSLAFAIYNWHPAHIFLGDVGSITFGVLIGLALMLIAASGERLFVSTIIASMYYLADGGMTILVRALKGEKIWQPHLNHFFQQAIRKRLSHKRIMTEVILCNYWLMMLSVGALFYPVVSLLMAILIVTRVVIKFSEK